MRFMKLQSSSKTSLGRAQNSLAKMFTLNAWVEFAWLNLGTFFIALGVYYFKFPNGFNTGGISGFSLVLDKIWPALSPSMIMFIINNILLLLGYLVFGKSFGFKTFYSSQALSGMMWCFEKIYPVTKPLTNQPFLELFFAVLLPGIGAAIIFNIDASNGGTDIIGMILKKYISLNIGTVLGITDAVIVMLGFPFYPIEVSLFSVLGLFIKSNITDSVIESLNRCKYFTIITQNPDMICDYITQELHGSATISQAKGAYTKKDKAVIFTVMRRNSAVRLQRFMQQNDPTAFMMITNTSEIIGKGYRAGH